MNPKASILKETQSITKFHLQCLGGLVDVDSSISSEEWLFGIIYLLMDVKKVT